MKAARELLQLGRSARCAQAGAEKTCVQLADLGSTGVLGEEILHAATILHLWYPKGDSLPIPPPLSLGHVPLWGSVFSSAE